MWLTLKSLFKYGYMGKENEPVNTRKKDIKAHFSLTADGITVGKLSYEDKIWTFQYTDEFKEHIDEYNLIIGFPDINKVYESPVLWPFFQIRIPGLKQPAIKEILEKENIDKDDEVSLLKYFGRLSISNPYKLEYE